MMRGNRYSLKTLLKRFLFGTILAVVGSWAITLLKFDSVLNYVPFDLKPEILQFIDYCLMGVAGIGLVIVLFVLPQLISRVSRVSSLGEQKW